MMRTAVVISSCDLYKDCWQPLIYSFEKNWPDCPFPKYLISNFDDICNSDFDFIKVGPHLGWGSNTKKALLLIDCDYIVYFQEDYFIEKKIDSSSINEHLDYCFANNIDYLRLGWPFRDIYKIKGTIYNEDPLDKKYTACLQPAIWKKKTLLKFCIDGWTGWDYERNILNFIKQNEITFHPIVIDSAVYSQKGIYITAGTAIRKGLWTRSGAIFLKQNGFYKELNGRKVEGRILSFLMQIKPSSLFKIPASIIIRIFQKAGINM